MFLHKTRRPGVVPKSSSPDVSRDGATLMHRLVNLATTQRSQASLLPSCC